MNTDADADIQERNRPYNQQDVPAWTGPLKLCFNLCQLPENEQTALLGSNARDTVSVCVHSACPMSVHLNLQPLHTFWCAP